jgi:hypothetical protein
VLLGLLLAGCNGAATPTPPAAAPTLSLPPAEGVAPGEVGEGDTLRDDQLVVWLPPLSGLAAEGNAGVVFNNVFVQFEQQHPGIRLDIQVKAESGPASLFTYLRSAQQAAPTILPDLVLINTQQLWQLVDLGMVQPIEDADIPAGVDFFAVAQRAVVYREQRMGLPYALDVVHLAYDPADLPRPPADWATLLAGETSYLFPGAEAATSNELLLQYVGAGGVLRADGAIEDPAALQAYFDFVTTARAAGVIPAGVVDLAGYPSVWRTFSAAPESLAAVQVNQYLPNLANPTPFGYGALPTRTGTTLTVVETWAFAVLTPDANRRRLAVALVHALLAPEVQGPWSQFAARLPTQGGALALWTQDQAYRTFLQTLLEHADTPPNGLAFAEFARRLQSTRAGLIRGELSVEAAMQLMAGTE